MNPLVQDAVNSDFRYSTVKKNASTKIVRPEFQRSLFSVPPSSSGIWAPAPDLRRARKSWKSQDHAKSRAFASKWSDPTQQSLALRIPIHNHVDTIMISTYYV